jgi:DNA topoisomerase
MREYARALGFTLKGDHYEKGDTILSCAAGHLLELAEDTAYRGEGKWDKSYLPLLLQIKDYKYEPKKEENRQAQLNKLGSLLNDPEIGNIIVATDPDREGELIFRYIYNYFKCKKPFIRVWNSALVDEGIRKAFAHPTYKQGDPFLENLCKSGYARAFTDWLIGVNATQAATLQLGQGKLLSIGRVQSTILKIICDRYIKNKGHEKTYTYKIITNHSYNGTTYTTESPIYESKEQAQAVFNGLLPAHKFVSHEVKKVSKNPPLLHTLDSLTIVANKLYKYTPDQVLASAQKLYEGKYLSYPRTEDPYITEEGYYNLQKFFVGLCRDFLGVTDFAFMSKPKSVDDSKITGSHDALIPTGYTNSLESLAEQERRVFELILYRCLESFSDSSQYEKGIYLFDNQGTPFKTNTNKLLYAGWERYTPKNKTAATDEEGEADDEKITVLDLPYRQGDAVAIEAKNVREIESRPPAIYTPATLTDDLCNLDKFLQEQSPEVHKELSSQIDLKGLQIGTKGTRPGILDTLIQKRQFITLQKNKYLPTELGLQFYNAIKDLEVVNVTQTAHLEYQLKQITEGKLLVTQYYNNLLQYVQNMVHNIFSIEATVKVERPTLGTCPSCKKGQIVEYPQSYGCTEFKNGCKFGIWKEIAKKKITHKNVEDLITKGRTSLIKGFKGKSGNDFEAYLVLDSNLKTAFEFNNNKK